jgi:hypothetical protein
MYLDSEDKDTIKKSIKDYELIVITNFSSILKRGGCRLLHPPTYFS